MIRQLLYIIFVIATLTACSKDYFLGDEAQLQQSSGLRQTICFDGARGNMTRGTAIGSEAATLLGNMFRVYGTYTRNGQKTVDFDNYCVAYSDTLASSSSNSTGWTYAGLKSLGTTPCIQSEKYWPLNASKYTFIAFSGLSDSLKIVSDSLNSFSFNINNINKVFASDRVIANSEDYSLGYSANSDYVTNTVTFSFKHLYSLLRIGVYETIEGYAVSNMRFYYDDNYEAESGTSTKTSAALQGEFPLSADYDITYDRNDTVLVSCKTTSTANNLEFGKLKYTTAESNLVAGGYMKADGSVDAKGDSAFIGTTRSTVTYACKNAIIDQQLVKDSEWQIVMPYPENQSQLVFRADFDLIPLDASGTIITVKGAKAVVDVKYAQWKPNFAYTYIFRITKDVQPALYPITLDAVVSNENSEESEHEIH